MQRTPRAGCPRSGRSAVAALVGAVALSLAACTADVAPSAPRAHDVTAANQPANDLLGLGGTVSGLGETLSSVLSNLRLYDCPTPDFGSVTENVGPAGGVIKLGPHVLVIPPGALDRTVAITASAPEGQHVAIEFKPEGLRFRYPAGLRLSYAHCDHRPLLPRVVYIDDLLSILELLPSLNESREEAVTTRVKHFSGYAIAD